MSRRPDSSHSAIRPPKSDFGGIVKIARLILLGLAFVAVSYRLTAGTASRIYYASFDNQTVAPATAAWGGIARLVTTVPGSQDPARLGQDFGWVTGYGGTGYAVESAQSVDTYWYWSTGSPYTWRTNELYQSFWFRFESSTPNWSGNANIKMMYPQWSATTSHASVVVYQPTSLYTGVTFNGAADLATTRGRFINYVEGLKIIDGKWHRLEMCVQFSPARLRVWYDDMLIRDDQWTRDWLPKTMNGLSIPSIKAVGVTSTFRRIFDEIEIWDGLPDYRLGGASSPPPAPPVGLKIAGR